MTWTPERRKRQAEAIHRWKPWAKSTGATSPEGKRKTARNAYKGGKRAEQRAIAKEIRQLANLLKRNW